MKLTPKSIEGSTSFVVTPNERDLDLGVKRSLVLDEKPDNNEANVVEKEQPCEKPLEDLSKTQVCLIEKLFVNLVSSSHVLIWSCVTFNLLF